MPTSSDLGTLFESSCVRSDPSCEETNVDSGEPPEQVNSAGPSGKKPNEETAAETDKEKTNQGTAERDSLIQKNQEDFEANSKSKKNEICSTKNLLVVLIVLTLVSSIIVIAGVYLSWLKPSPTYVSTPDLATAAPASTSWPHANGTTTAVSPAVKLQPGASYTLILPQGSNPNVSWAEFEGSPPVLADAFECSRSDASATERCEQAFKSNATALEYSLGQPGIYSFNVQLTVRRVTDSATFKDMVLRLSKNNEWLVEDRQVCDRDFDKTLHIAALIDLKPRDRLYLSLLSLFTSSLKVRVATAPRATQITATLIRAT